MLKHIIVIDLSVIQKIWKKLKKRYKNYNLYIGKELH